MTLPAELRDFCVSKQHYIEELKRKNCCRESIRWLSGRAKTLEDVLQEHPEWVFWALSLRAVPDELSEEDVSKIVKAAALLRPAAALEVAPDLLPPDLLDRCAEKRPWTALVYAAQFLTHERLKWCAKQFPEINTEFDCSHLVRGLKIDTISCLGGTAILEHTRGKILLSTPKEVGEGLASYEASENPLLYFQKIARGTFHILTARYLSGTCVFAELRLQTESGLEVKLSTSYACDQQPNPLTPKSMPSLIFKEEREIRPYKIRLEGEPKGSSGWKQGEAQRVVLAPSAHEALEYIDPLKEIKRGIDTGILQGQENKVRIFAVSMLWDYLAASKIVDLKTLEGEGT